MPALPDKANEGSPHDLRRHGAWAIESDTASRPSNLPVPHNIRVRMADKLQIESHVDLSSLCGTGLLRIPPPAEPQTMPASGMPASVFPALLPKGVGATTSNRQRMLPEAEAWDQVPLAPRHLPSADDGARRPPVMRSLHMSVERASVPVGHGCTSVRSGDKGSPCRLSVGLPAHEHGNSKGLRHGRSAWGALEGASSSSCTDAAWESSPLVQGSNGAHSREVSREVTPSSEHEEDGVVQEVVPMRADWESARRTALARARFEAARKE